ncbi:MAG: tetratricopeptide repeat protein [Oligoflexales bacterium]|nr:tetratricopeptide repeat protein [Oligoflexales bacterium]
MNKLKNYPKLEAWFKKSGRISGTESIELLLYYTCLSLETCEYSNNLLNWCQSFETLIKSTSDIDDNIEDIEDLFNGFQVSFMAILAEIALSIIESPYEEMFLNLMSYTATQTGSASYRFMAAWTALNTGNLERCIRECCMVTEDHVKIKTIQGQALLEDGRVHEAIKILESTVSLHPKEILAWFQLAKAHHLLAQWNDAWKCLETCRKELPDNIEIAAYMAIIAIEEKPTDITKVNIAWDSLISNLHHFQNNYALVNSLFELSVLSKDEKRVIWLFEYININELLTENEFVKKIPEILSKMNALNWRKGSYAFLKKITEQSDKF